MNLDLGKMRHRIDFGNIENVTNSNGFQENQFVKQFSMWAQIKNLYGKEFWQAKAQHEEITVKFYTRYNKNINSSLCIMFQGDVYEILPPVDDIDYMHKVMEIKAKILDKDKI